MSKALFEEISGVIRVFNDNENYGDKYSWCSTYKMIDFDTIEFMGVMKAPTHEQRRAIEIACLEKGINKAIWFRHKNRNVKTIDVSIEKKYDIRIYLKNLYQKEIESDLKFINETFYKEKRDNIVINIKYLKTADSIGNILCRILKEKGYETYILNNFIFIEII